MKNSLRNILQLLLFVIVLANVILSCSTQKNTGASRWYHSFTAKYNTYYNGSLAYIEGSLAKENGNKDNYTEIIPLYTVGNKSSREIGKSNFETAITKAEKAIHNHSIKKRPEWKKNRRKTEKDIEWLNRREYNPFIWKAWMLMGRSQFYSGSFDEAAATFSYMSRLYRTQPAIYGKARAWLAKCYIEQDWIYDAEDVIRNMKRDSIDWRAQKEWDYTLADYYLHTEDYDNAINYLKLVIKHERRAKQRAREYFLLGQICASQNKHTEAYNAFRHVIRQNPPYELEFNARIAMTEVMPAGQFKTKISRLKRMARSDKNAEYLDQVYYAMGNVYLAERDTAHAIGAYEQGNKKATRSGIEKGVLLLHLGDLYWLKEKFGDAKRCYGEAIGLLDKDRKDYAQLSERSKILDELAPHTDAVYLQDSLQALAKMSEKDRNAAIDRVIEALKKKEKEERLNKLEQEAQQNGMGNAGIGNAGNNNNTAAKTPTMPNNQSGTWYFYNPIAVQQGKQAFQQQWGRRENTDNWQRVNKTVVSNDNLSDSDQSGDNVNPTDSIGAADASEEDKAKNDSAVLDPHKREYYLAMIPFTDEQITASNKIIAEGLFHSGIIFKDKLNNLPLSEKALSRLNKDYAKYITQMDEAYYHLFLLYSRKGESTKAIQFKDLLADKYEDSQWTKIVNDPYFEENARFGKHREDSLYADTYDAFRNDQHSTISRNYHISEQRYPVGAHRDKFIFIAGLSRLNQNDADSCVRAMERVVKEYPQSEVAGIAGMIINGVKAGRKIHGSKFDIADIWNYRAETLSEANDTTGHKLSDDPHTEFIFLMTYNPDSLHFQNDSIILNGTAVENQLLYEIAKYNFSSYLVRNFEIDIEDFNGMHRLAISGFQNYDEALVYARNLYQNTHIMALAHGSRNLVISRENLALLGVQYSYNDYDKFYSEHFIKLPEPAVDILYEQHLTPEQYDPEAQLSTSNPDSEDTPANISNNPVDEPTSTDIMDIMDIEDATPASTVTTTPVEDNSFDLPTSDDQNTHQTNETTLNSPISDNKTTTQNNVNSLNSPISDNKTTTQNNANSLNSPISDKQKDKASTSKTTTTTTTRQDINADILEIIDESAPKSKTPASTKKKEDKQQDDDEYFDFDGF